MSLTKVTYSMIKGASVNVLDFGAVQDGITDSTAYVQAAMNSLSSSGGYVFIPKGVVYDADSLTFVDFVTLIDQSWSDGLSYNLNMGNPGGAVNEFRLVSGFHPGLILDAHNDWTLGTLGPGQTYNNRSSVVYRVNGASIWQHGNDTRGAGVNDWTLYRNSPTSYQCLTMTVDGKAIYGQTSAGIDFTADYSHNFRGSGFAFENTTGDINLILRRKDNSARKIIKLDGTNDSLSVNNTADTTVIFRLKNEGNGYFKTGVSGGAYTTVNRNAIAVTSDEIGIMVFDTTLGKPVWLKNNVGPVWVDATGTAV